MSSTRRQMALKEADYDAMGRKTGWKFTNNTTNLRLAGFYFICFQMHRLVISNFFLSLLLFPTNFAHVVTFLAEPEELVELNFLIQTEKNCNI